MDKAFNALLLGWEKPFLRDQDLIPIFQQNNSRRYDTVKYAIKKGFLIPVRRGLYLLGAPYRKNLCEPFEIAQIIYGPSYISLDSALSFHGWIPEAVYTTTSVSVKRAKNIETPLGIFRYTRTPSAHFFLNVQRVVTQDNEIFLIAEPWKAIADSIYCYEKKWNSIEAISSDLRIEIDVMHSSNKSSLLHIAQYYPNKTVRNLLSTYVKELC